MSKFKPHHVDARRWFDGTNTYHAVTVYGTVEGRPSLECSHVTYGYGDMWTVTLREIVSLPEGNLYQVMRNLGVTYRVSDVTRKKDL